jgi:hypothetical protein
MANTNEHYELTLPLRYRLFLPVIDSIKRHLSRTLGPIFYINIQRCIFRKTLVRQVRVEDQTCDSQVRLCLAFAVSPDLSQDNWASE